MKKKLEDDNIYIYIYIIYIYIYISYIYIYIYISYIYIYIHIYIHIYLYIYIYIYIYIYNIYNICIHFTPKSHEFTEKKNFMCTPFFSKENCKCGLFLHFCQANFSSISDARKTCFMCQKYDFDKKE